MKARPKGGFFSLYRKSDIILEYLLKYMEKQAQTRRNSLTGHEVIFAPKRQQRPNDMKAASKPQSCPFCGENVKKKSIKQQLPSTGKWQAAAINNIFPALSTSNKRAYGYQEIIIDTNNHCENFADLNIKQISSVLQLFQVRSKKLSLDKKINYILCFKNQGAAAGASLKHIHSQIFASAILPHDIIEEREMLKKFKIKNNDCPYCQMIKVEDKSKRLFYQDKNIIAFCPYASEFPFEAWVISRRHVDNITLLKESEIKSLAAALKLISTKLKDLGFDFNFFTHNDVNNSQQHFYLKIQPRKGIWAGVELGSGLIINSTLPEEAAKYYKK